jgi:hypothetical protein
MPYSLSLKRVKKVRRGFFRVAGTLNLAGKAPTGVRVALFGAVVKKGTLNFKVLARTTTKRGKYVFNRRLPKKKTIIFAEREPSETSCVAPIVAAPCVGIESNAISRLLLISPPKKRHR